MVGLADCNNFYASCERVFNPSLIGKPVVVLSNNDGCIIARSNEAKALGIEMGAPAFEVEDFLIKNKVYVFSSNYTLYGDLSSRVMTTLSQFTPEMEIYSIDEAFLSFHGFDANNLLRYGKEIVTHTGRSTGIPVSMGIAPTKALAKIANKKAKKDPSSGGVFVIHPNMIHDVLKTVPIGDVWGIGARYAQKLRQTGIQTAYDFSTLPGGWVKKEMSIVGYRLWEELKGFPRFEMEIFSKPKKNICTARSFGKMLTAYKDLEEAVANYAASCAEKLRRQKSVVQTLMVFLHTNEHRHDLPQYSRHLVIKLPVATNSTLEITRYALKGLRSIYRKGFYYKKAGVILMDIISRNAVQGNFFYTLDYEKHNKAMMVMDAMNSRYGKITLKTAAQGNERPWKLRQEKLSPCYTTRWDQLLSIKCR